MNKLCKACHAQVEGLNEEEVADFLEELEKDLYSDDEEEDEPNNFYGQIRNSSSSDTVIQTPPASPLRQEPRFKRSNTRLTPYMTSTQPSLLRQSQAIQNTPKCMEHTGSSE